MSKYDPKHYRSINDKLKDLLTRKSFITFGDNYKVFNIGRKLQILSLCVLSIFIIANFVFWQDYTNYNYAINKKVEKISQLDKSYKNLLATSLAYKETTLKKFKNLHDILSNNKFVKTDLIVKEVNSAISLWDDIFIAKNNNVFLEQEDLSELNIRKLQLERDIAIVQKQSAYKSMKALDKANSNMKNFQSELMQRILILASNSASHLRSLLSDTGIDVARLIDSKQDKYYGQGGPLLPAVSMLWQEDRYDSMGFAVNSSYNRWEALNKLVDNLPLAFPVRKNWYITSDFGLRKDPIKRNKLSNHMGLDMGAPFDTAVYSSGSGRIVHAGRRGSYGKFIEIDHGHGVTTRYAHLNKIFVRKGQKVNRNTVIGLVGATGRTSGAHLHYELLSHRRHMDPVKFMKLN